MIDARELLRISSTRDHSRAQLIRAVMAAPSPQNRLAQLTSLSEATVSTIVRSLVQEKVLTTESGADRSKLVRLADGVRGAAVGIDLGYTHVSVAVRGVGDSELFVQTAPFGIEAGPAPWLDNAVALVEDLVAEAGMTTGDIVSVGLGTPGATDPREGNVVTFAVPPLRSPGEPAPPDPAVALTERLKLNVVADNDANLGAYAEFLHGAGRDAETLFYVKASHGIGAGVIIDGMIFRGRHGIAGELGHVTVDPRGPVCRCGSRGCLEAVIGENQLIEQVRAAYAGHTRWAPTSLNALIERARWGEPVDRRVLQDAARVLGLALAQVGNLLDPDKIVIGGRLSQAGEPELLINPLRETFSQYALPRVRETPVVITQLGAEAQIRGAVALGLRSPRLA